MDKKAIRKEIKRQTLALTSAQSVSQSENVVKRLLEIISQREPQTVALFSPLKDEVQISPLAEKLACRVVLPRVEGDDMEFYDYVPQAMASGAYGIVEPQSGEPCRAEDIDLMIVPGVAFASDGRRLGRGKGYYDRYLSQSGFRAYCVGVCYACQLREDISAEMHDKKVEKVIFPK